MHRIVKIFSAPLSLAAQMRVLPAAFSLAEPMKDPGYQMPADAYTFWVLTQGKDTNHWRMSIPVKRILAWHFELEEV